MLESGRASIRTRSRAGMKVGPGGEAGLPDQRTYSIRLDAVARMLVILGSSYPSISLDEEQRWTARYREFRGTYDRTGDRKGW